jgi:D-3-phosphoglycerate dehydrogenase
MKKPTVICAADLRYASESREILERNFDVRYIRANIEVLKENLPDADAYFASLKVQLTRELMALSPGLKAIATASTGLDHIDLEAAKERGIEVLSLKEDRKLLDNITATAELAWALILCCARRICQAVETSRQGVWARDALRGHQLSNKTLGILGCGRLGTIMAQYGNAFRMRVIGHDIADVEVPGIERVSFEQLLRQSDVLTIHIHLNEQNKNLIDRKAFEKIKPGAILVNTSRGAIINEADMIDALENETLAAAGLDVICGEWLEDLSDHPLVKYSKNHDNLIITPHVGGVTYESQDMAYSAAAQKLVECLKTI